MKTKIGTEVANVTRDSDTTFKVKRSKVNLKRAGHIVAASRTACLFIYLFIYYLIMPRRFCFCICLFVRYHDNSKSCGRIFERWAV